MYFQRIILKLAKDGFQIHPVQPSFQRGQREITPQSCAKKGRNEQEDGKKIGVQGSRKPDRKSKKY